MTELYSNIYIRSKYFNIPYTHISKPILHLLSTTCTGWNLIFQSTEWWLNGHWMATEWLRGNEDSVTIQWSFSRKNCRHSDLAVNGHFWKTKLLPNLRFKGKVRWPSGQGDISVNIWGMLSFCLSLYFELFFHNFPQLL